MDNTSFNLASPPRNVPWPVQASVLFGGFGSQFGWLFFGFGMIFVWAFGIFSLLNAAYFWFGPLETTTGTVAAVSATGASENDVPVYANQFLFRVERLEDEYRGESYTTGQQFAVGDSVTVEYRRDRPDIARIQGTRAGTFSPWVFCFVSIFPAVGLAFIAFSLKSGFAGGQLLKHGQLTQGKLISKEPTNTRINNQMVYKLTFEFTADNGLPYQAIARSHQPAKLEDEAQERILYNPANPKNAVLVDNLPGSPEIDEFGQIYVANFGKSMLVLILPALVVMVHGGIFLGMLLRP
ncbi:MAG: hypothetical protein FOGNACKC_04221 [Anaerolineae bacterium]|nr:hypothetical protein [Anaerolineae bacterium]